MSGWPSPCHSGPSLQGLEGDLVCVSIAVEPRLLEELLEALAEVQFPINPQIYHQAAQVYVYPDGHEHTEPTTLVEFPAYAGRLDEVGAALEPRGFDLRSLHAKSMLEGLHSEVDTLPAPPGAPYCSVRRRKQAASFMHC